jgi:hypothetical protein
MVTSTGTSPPTISPSLTPIASPTAVILIDQSRFDPDVKPPIQVLHNPPLIAGSDEEVKLKFDLVCAYGYDAPLSYCNFLATLFVSYGENDDLTPITLQKENQNGWEYWTTTLPATNQDGEPFRYYLQVKDQGAGLEVRFPSAGVSTSPRLTSSR